MGLFTSIKGAVTKLLPMAGTAVGGVFGGPAGAAIGAKLGGIAQGAFASGRGALPVSGFAGGGGMGMGTQFSPQVRALAAAAGVRLPGRRRRRRRMPTASQQQNFLIAMEQMKGFPEVRRRIAIQFSRHYRF